MVESKIKIKNTVGLHARPASLFVQTASRFTSTIKVRNITSGSELVNAKSIINVLTLGVLQNHEILIEADGADEEKAIKCLRELIDGDFLQS